MKRRPPALLAPAGTLLLLAAAVLLGGCASRAPLPSPTPSPAPFPFEKDGPGANPPPDLHQVPDAAPRIEPVRTGGPNKPYEVLGKRYAPLAGDPPLVERGLASWYGRKFHGRPTASGEVYNMYAMTAAHPTMPIPSYARVRNPKNGREVLVRINDRGPFHSERIIDLSYTAALKLDLLRGVAPVEVERITFEDIRSGAWLRGRDAPPGLGIEPQEPPPVYVASGAGGAPERSSTQSLRDTPPAEDPIAQIAASQRAIAKAEPTAQTQAKIAPGFWLQLGAFAKLDGAEKLREHVVQSAEAFAPLLTVVREQALHRLQAGPYASREQASAAAEQLRAAMAVKAVVVERR